MEIAIGQAAPSFSLYNTAKTLVSLHGLKGQNVILLFFPLAFTSTCTKELCSVRDDIAHYNNANATVFGISVDSVYTLQKFKEEQHLNFDLLSDFNKEASEAYNVLYETFGPMEMKGVSKRAAFVINKVGKLIYAEVCASPGDVPDFTAIKNSLQKGD
ncbi:MAG: peroxiredoxin [Segetibacter sp.]|nr:peroxiredoxin [Segetibacter sp.]